MDLAMVNNSLRKLDKLKWSIPSRYEYNENILTEDDEPLLLELKTKLQEVESLLMDLKGTNNSSATQVYRWVKNTLPLINPALSQAILHFSATEASFELIINCERAFNLNLKYKKLNSSQAVPVNEDHFNHFTQNIKDRFDFNSAINQHDIAGYLSLEKPTVHPQRLVVTIKYTKKLIRDERIMNDILKDTLTQMWDHCQFMGTI